MSKLDELIEQALHKRDQYKALDKEATSLRAEFDELKFQIVQKCHEMGVDSASIKGVANVNVTTRKHCSVQDWDALLAYMKENDAYYLFQKRISSQPYQDLLTLEGLPDLPGCTTFEQEDVNIRRL
jgi:hypothetical protein